MILSGILLNPIGEAWANQSVKLTSNLTSDNVLQYVSKEFITDSTGFYEVDIPNGFYSVSVFAGRLNTSIGNILISEDTTQQTINELLMLGQVAQSPTVYRQVAENAASALASKVAAQEARDQAVDAASSVVGALVEYGSVDLSSGQYPSKPTTAGFWKVIVGGEVDGIDYGVGDSLVYSKTIDQFFKIDNTENVSSVNGQTGVVVLTKSDVGLPLVNNTPDNLKPVSTAQQQAFDTKVDKIVGKSLSTEDYTTTEKSKLAGAVNELLVDSKVTQHNQDPAAHPELSSGVLKPNWAGKLSGWPDPFFRYLEVDQLFDGKRRWRAPGVNVAVSSWYLEGTSEFGGRELVKVAGSGTIELSGPMIYLSDLGAKPGDVITIRALVVGDGAVVSFPGRPKKADHTHADVQKNASPATITASATPQLVTLSFATTLDTDYVLIYPFTPTSGKGFRIQSLWAYSGAPMDGPSWPIVDSEQYLAGKIREAVEASEQAQLLGKSLQPKIEYAVTTTQVVRADSEVVALAVTNPQIGNLHSLPFRGWGEIYSPAGVSFNALRAKLIGRAETPAAGRWSRINVIVKTGNDANSGAVVAVGSISVQPDSDTLQNVTIMLQSPTTGDLITLSDANLEGQYFIGMYAENALGQPAGMGKILATQLNSLDKHYYLTSADPSSAWLVAAGANHVGFEHLLLTNPRIEDSYSASDALKADMGVLLSWIPPKVYVTQGEEGSVYLDNLIADDAEDYAWAISGTSQGQLQHERWTINPSGSVSSTSMEISIHDKRTGSMLTSLAVALVGSAANAGEGTTRRVQLIGDSFANSGYLTQTLLDNASGDVMGVELIGTLGSGLNRHEGRGGWRIDDYATVGRTYYKFNVSGVAVEPAINSTIYSSNGATLIVQEVSLTGGVGTFTCSVTGGTPSASGTLTKISGIGDNSVVFSSVSPVTGNPFWINGELNYGAYLLNNGLSTPDTVFIELGVNDVFGQTSDEGARARAVEQMAMLDSLISSIKAAGVRVVALIPPAGPSGNQDSFGSSYGTSASRWRVKRNNIIWNQELVSKYTGLELSGTYIAPAGLNWDTKNNASRAAAAPVNSRSSVTIERMNNGVHPAISGYQQLGDSMWAFLKCTVG